MKKTYLSIFVLFLISCFSPSCIEEYKMPETLSISHEAELVIQGRILAGEESVIYISKTQPLGETRQETPITHAKVTVIGQNGYESDLAIYDEQQMTYLVDTKNISENTHYAIRVELDDETYQSSFQTIYNTPEIEEITYKEREDGVSLHVSTSNANNGARAYMWSYEEDWEFHADINMAIVNDGVMLYSENFYQLNGTQNPYNFCWGHKKSNNIIVYSTEGLKENQVKEHELTRVPTNDIRISYIYCISVKQWCLSPEAYRYFRTVKLYTEDTGGLFAPMPAEVPGNVSCISNPDLKVHGYVIASNVKTKRLFVYQANLQKIHSEYSNCSYSFVKDYMDKPNWENELRKLMRDHGFAIFTPSGQMDEESILYHNTCVDCRQTAGATKKRPDFWPNNHE